MDKFRASIQRRVLWMSVAVIGMAVIFFILLLNQNRFSELPPFILGFQIGVFSFMMLLLLFLTVKCIAALRNEKALKKLYIEEHDERKKLILLKTGAMGTNIVIFGLAFATVISGFFNATVFFSLFGATLFTTWVKGIFKIYYLRKI